MLKITASLPTENRRMFPTCIYPGLESILELEAIWARRWWLEDYPQGASSMVCLACVFLCFLQSLSTTWHVFSDLESDTTYHSDIPTMYVLLCLLTLVNTTDIVSTESPLHLQQIYRSEV